MNENVEASAPSRHITLTEATRYTPARLTPNAIWRWCRRGVRSRTGKRVRLEHVRIGGRIYTSKDWLDQFGRALAEADTEYFVEKDEAADRIPPRNPVLGSPRDQKRAARQAAARANVDAQRGREAAEINRELEEEGL